MPSTQRFGEREAISRGLEPVDVELVLKTFLTAFTGLFGLTLWPDLGKHCHSSPLTDKVRFLTPYMDTYPELAQAFDHFSLVSVRPVKVAAGHL
jgi:hypothetical protein